MAYTLEGEIHESKTHSGKIDVHGRITVKGIFEKYGVDWIHLA
jgi:hypothetical protein